MWVLQLNSAPTPGLLVAFAFITHTADMLIHVIKREPGVGVVAQFCSHTAAPIALADPVQCYICCDAEVKFAPHSFAAPTPGLQKQLQPLLEPRFTPRANYHRKGPKIQHKIDFIYKKNEPFGGGSNV
jgi:hypothetical protein